MWIQTLRMSHADLEVYACRMRTWSESACEGRVLTLYIWLEADHRECGILYASGLGIGVDRHSTISQIWPSWGLPSRHLVSQLS